MSPTKTLLATIAVTIILQIYTQLSAARKMAPARCAMMSGPPKVVGQFRVTSNGLSSQKYFQDVNIRSAFAGYGCDTAKAERD